MSNGEPTPILSPTVIHVRDMHGNTETIALAAGPVANVFAGAPDGRQSTDVAMPTSRFRPRYRALTDGEKELHHAIKAKASELEALFERVNPGRYRSLGFTALEEAIMWTVKEFTA
jgi:hypothetical protein